MPVLQSVAGTAGGGREHPAPTRDQIILLRIDAAKAAVSCSLLLMRVFGAAELGCISRSPCLQPAAAAAIASGPVLKLLYGCERAHLEVLRAVGPDVLSLAVSSNLLTPEDVEMLVRGRCV